MMSMILMMLIMLHVGDTDDNYQDDDEGEEQGSRTLKPYFAYFCC